MQGTQKALMARGLDSEHAAQLAKNGWTLNKLKQADAEALRSAGLSNKFIDELFGEARPPIPTETLMKVLFSNRYQCCVCRNSKLSVIVHHIEEWAESRLHDIDNLAVLCLNHHDQAHTKKTLSKNLDANSLRDAKKKWEDEVKRLDASSVSEAMRLDYSNWNYINGLRVFEIAKTIGVEFSKVKRFNDIVNAGLVQPDGLPTPVYNDVPVLHVSRAVYYFSVFLRF